MVIPHGGEHFVGEVDGAIGAAVVGKTDELTGYFQPDVALGFFGGTANVGGKDHVVPTLEGGFEFFVLGLGLHGEYVNGGTGQSLVVEGGGQGINIHHTAAAGVEEEGAFFHPADLFLANHAHRIGGARHVEGHHIGAFHEIAHVDDPGGVTHAELVHDVVVEDAHAEGLGENGDLLADVAIADDAEGLSTHFRAACRGLVPFAGVGIFYLAIESAEEHTNIGHDELGHGARVGVGRIKDGNSPMFGRVQIHLVGADTEGTEGQEPVGFLEDGSCDLGLGANPKNMNVFDESKQFFFIQRTGAGVHVKALFFKALHTLGMNPFEKENFDFALGKGGGCHDRTCQGCWVGCSGKGELYRRAGPLPKV